MRPGLLALAAAAVLTACAPIPRDVAESQCFQQARLAKQPRGSVGLGVTSGGPAATGEITVTSDFLMGKDPSAVYDACVFQKSGQPPSRPLFDRPDWK